jgi:carbamoyl-phosphate synthase large subunit
VRIAISGAGKRVQLIRLARTALADHVIVSVDSNPEAPALIEGEAWGTIFRAGSDEFASSVVALVQALEIDVWISVIDSELLPLSLVNPSVTRFVLPDSPQAVMDKFLMFHECQRLGIASPDTYLEPPKNYPYVAKDRNGSASSGYRIVTNSREIVSGHHSELIFQPLLNGRHLDVDFYVDFITHQVSSVVVREILNRHQGETFAGRFVHAPPGVIKSVETIAVALGLRGPNNADFIEVDGVPLLLDINARFGGNYPATHSVGHDYFRLLNVNLSGEQTSRVVGYPTGLMMRKHFQIEVGE